MNPLSNSDPEPQEPTGRQVLRTGLLIAGSALLGGLAVVLWNRNSLSRLRQPVEGVNQPSVRSDDEDE